MSLLWPTLMSESFLALNDSDQRDILNTAANRLRRQAVVLEKDVWICWVLQTLFSIPNHHPMAFKGGTSLSKVYGIVDRFSEDVDVTLDYRGFGDAFDPFAHDASKNQQKKFSERLRSGVAIYVNDIVEPALAAAAGELPTRGKHEIRIDENGEKVWFAYPSVVEEPDDYLTSEVLLEFGGRNVIDPNERHKIGPDIADLTQSVDYPLADVTVLAPTRTFWEKATLIHVECNRGRLSDRQHRLSRHWFDLMCLMEHDVGQSAIENRELLLDVVSHKKVFFNASYARYDDCLEGRLRLVPEGDELLGLESDYRQMLSAGMVNSEAPAFGALMTRIREIETQVNDRS